ncbi:MAG TPA: hypothetical protein PLA94_03580 [Myxococcota bacterium]|nr:hypothetical protein [Myxococcota bacterium]HND29048.1 hypothetical protein [Myxococcota bacterium]
MFLLALLLACGESGPCKSAQIDKVISAIQVTSKPQRVALVAQGLVESCTLAPSLKKSLTDIPRLPPEMRTVVAMKTVTEDPESWEKACPGGTAMLAQAATLGPSGRVKKVVEVCEVDFIEENEMGQAQDTLLLAILLRSELKGISTGNRSILLRTLSGL